MNREFDSNTLNIIQCIAAMSLFTDVSVDFANKLYQYVEFLSLMNSQALIWEREALEALYEERRNCFCNEHDGISLKAITQCKCKGPLLYFYVTAMRCSGGS